MPPAKHNLTMDKGTSLIYSLFDVTLSQDVSAVRRILYMHHGLPFVFLCVPVIFAVVNLRYCDMASM